MDRLIYEIGKKNSIIRVYLKIFEGIKLIDIRKYYTKNDTEEILPTKKGISLNRNQYNNFINELKTHQTSITDFFGEQNESEIYNLNIESFISGRLFNFVHENGHRELQIDKKFVQKFENDKLILLKNILQILYSCLYDVFDDQEDIDRFLDYFSDKLLKLQR